MSTTIAAGWWNAPTRFLPAGQVDAGLAADRRIDLGDERRRDLDDRHAAEPASRPGTRPRRRARRRRSRRAARRARPGAPQRARGRVLDDRHALRRLALGQHDPLDRPAVVRERRRDRASPAAAHAPGSETRIARRARSPRSASPTTAAAIPSPMTRSPPSDRPRSSTVGSGRRPALATRARRRVRRSRPSSATPFSRWAAE